MNSKNLAETDLYLPIKQLFERQGYEVKGEVNHCDLVAKKEGSSLVIVEMKKNLNLELLIQATERFALSEEVYIAFPVSSFSKDKTLWHRKKSGVVKLCRRIGIGLIGVHFYRVKKPFAEILLVPGPYSPRKSKYKSNSLEKEFANREGDPNLGGLTKEPIITAYRQEALRCAQLLKMHGPLKISTLKELGAGEKAGNILRDNHYNWFQRKERGVYQITEAGLKGLIEFKRVVKNLTIKPG